MISYLLNQLKNHIYKKYLFDTGTFIIATPHNQYANNGILDNLNSNRYLIFFLSYPVVEKEDSLLFF